jgi:nucleotide-binding universal stress UspA family protein
MKSGPRRTTRPRRKGSRRQRILVAVDFSLESERALEAAATLAKRSDASVTVIHVRPASDLRAVVEQDRGDLVRLTPTMRRSGLAEHYRTRLEAAGRKFPNGTTRLLRGWPPGVIVREAARGYDLVVIGTRGRGAVKSALLGSTAQEVLHRAAVPVVVVRSHGRR